MRILSSWTPQAALFFKHGLRVRGAVLCILINRSTQWYWFIFSSNFFCKLCSDGALSIIVRQSVRTSSGQADSISIWKDLVDAQKSSTDLEEYIWSEASLNIVIITALVVAIIWRISSRRISSSSSWISVEIFGTRSNNFHRNLLTRALFLRCAFSLVLWTWELSPWFR